MIQQNHTSLNKGSLRVPVRRTGVLNQRCWTSLNNNTGSIGAPWAHLRTQAHRATLSRTPAQWSGNLKHSDTFPIDARQAREPSHACVRSILSNRVLARDTDVYLWRFSPRKSSIEPSFSFYKDLEETLIKYQRRSWPLFDFHHANKTLHDLLELPTYFLRWQSVYELCLQFSSLRTKLTPLVQF